MRTYMSDDAVLKQLGERLLQYRLNKNMTQTALAKEAGISSRTINRVEHGQSTQLSNLIRLLRSLDLLQNLNALIPEPTPSPIQQMKLRGKSRKRASSPHKKEGEDKTWSWGDDE
jgi:transcriptional regulator with XRE-family HTH domain